MSACERTSGARRSLHLTAWLASGVVACFGSPGSGLESLSSRTDLVDAGVESLHNSPSSPRDARAEAQPPPVATPGAPIVGRGDNFSPNQADAGASDGPTSERAFADDAITGGPTGTASEAASCVVTFTVSGVFVDGFLVQDVVLGGDVLELGNWDPTLARNMAAANGTAGTWTLDVKLTDGEALQFKFGVRAGNQLTWETLSPDDPRELTVSCRDPGGLKYAGQFGLSPDGG